MYRCMLFVWPTEDAHASAAVNSVASKLITGAGRWKVAYKGSGALALQVGTDRGARGAHLLTRGAGAVLGTLFRTAHGEGSEPAPISFDEHESHAIVSSSGSHLIKNYWGAYIALISDPARRRQLVFRDPTANAPCYHALWRGACVFFSQLSDYVDATSSTLTVDTRQVVAHLVEIEPLTRACAFREVHDLPGGEGVEISNGRTNRFTLWSPAKFCVDRTFEDAHVAARELGNTVQMAVNAWAGCYENIAHRLSGGLDSSIVAGCLARAPSRPRVSCVTFFPENTVAGAIADPSLSRLDQKRERGTVDQGDERRFSREVASYCSFPLHEIERRVAELRLERVWNMPLAARPSLFSCNFDTDAVETALVQQEGFDAVFGGLAGDAVFYCLRRAVAAIDYSRAHPFGARMLAEIVHSARLSGDSLWQVAAGVLKHGYMRRRPPPLSDPFAKPHLLADTAIAQVDASDFRHPWLDSIAGLPAGKQYQLVNLAASGGGQFYTHTYHREQYAPSVNPLNAQPVVELCLRIPTWVLLTNGISRGLARLAFADRLPPSIAKRTTKGSTLKFWHHVLREHTAFLREKLLDGLLVKEGLLDKGKLDAYLVEDQPFLTVHPGQIVVYLGVEAWLRQAAALRQRAAA